MARYRLAVEVAHDLDAIADYIQDDNPERALSFVDDLIAKFDTIAERPNSFPLVADLPDGIRSALHGRYRIFFEIVDGTPRILRVVHGARDILNLFRNS